MTTRVKRKDNYGWRKMNRVLEYLKGNKHIKLTLRVESLSLVIWWIYIYYNTYDDWRDHTGIIKIISRGYVLSLSLKRNSNVNSSTWGGLVGEYNRMSVFLWSKHFIEAQGYMTEYWDDNKIIILMKNIGIASISKIKTYKGTVFYYKGPDLSRGFGSWLFTYRRKCLMC